MPVRNDTTLIETYDELNEQAGGQDPPEDHQWTFRRPHGDRQGLGRTTLGTLRMPVKETGEEEEHGDADETKSNSYYVLKHFSTFLGFPFSGPPLIFADFRPTQNPRNRPFAVS